METFENIITIFAIVSAVGFLAFLDKRYALGLNSSLSSNLSSNLSNDNWFGFSDKETKQKLAKKEQEIQELKQRVATLERIVTDPAEQLKKEIDSL